MSEVIIPDGGHPDFNRLVEGLLENTLSEFEMRHLETLLSNDPQALEECARRMKLHAELAEVCDPVHLELRQDRRMVIEGRGDSRRVSMREIRTAHFGNSRATAVLALDDMRNRGWWSPRKLALLVPSLIGIVVAGFWLRGTPGPDPPDISPGGPEDRTTVNTPTWSRRPENDGEMRFWLENMVVRHNYGLPEVEAATGMGQSEILKTLQRLGIRENEEPVNLSKATVSVMPYPGGRHSRLDGLSQSVNPQRDTKFSIFTPWSPHEYVVVDLPEAIQTSEEIIYLAHTDIPTRWTKMNVHLRPLEWKRSEHGDLSYIRNLPDGSAFGAEVKLVDRAVRMEMWIRNGTLIPMKDIRGQICVLPAPVEGFTILEPAHSLFESGYTLCRSSRGNRWIITAWHPLQRQIVYRTFPCFHADAKFGDCAPGETVHARGWLSFYEGDDVGAELARIEATGWRGGD